MKRTIEIDQEIWNLSKRRFFQAEARNWIIKSKTLEIMFIVIFGTFWALVYFGQHPRLIIGAAVVAMALAISIIARDNKFKGFFDGYEQGFMDAGNRTLDYWDGLEYTASKNYAALESILRDISEDEKTMSEKDKAMLEEEIRKGMVQAARFFKGV